MNKPQEFEFQPTLTGQSISLRPLRTDDFEALYTAASDPLVWALHPDPQRYQRDVFKPKFFDGALASGGAFAVVENASRKIIGSSRYYEWDPEKREVAIGFTFLSRDHWGGATNREMKRLMLDHAFRWAKVAWFHVGKNNLRSRGAMIKIGGALSHEGGREMNGVMHDYVYYKIEAPKLTSPTSRGKQ
jgi:RimJ/RimL family protein N-acetyltransferase